MGEISGNYMALYLLTFTQSVIVQCKLETIFLPCILSANQYPEPINIEFLSHIYFKFE